MLIVERGVVSRRWIHFQISKINIQPLTINLKEIVMTQTLERPKSGKKPAAAKLEFRVKDLSLAEWGRKEIMLAEQEMPGLMAVREEYAKQQPLKGLKIVGS